MKEKLLENKKKVLENLYLTVFAVFCLYFFMWTTTFWVSWPDFFVSDLRTVMIALIVVKASVSEKKSNWKELVFEIGLIAVFLAVKNRNGQEILLDTLLLILGAKEIASEKLIRVYTVTIATALFVTIGASLLCTAGKNDQNGIWNRLSDRFRGTRTLFITLLFLFEKKKNTICGIGNYGSDRRTDLHFLRSKNKCVVYLAVGRCPFLYQNQKRRCKKKEKRV